MRKALLCFAGVFALAVSSFPAERPAGRSGQDRDWGYRPRYTKDGWEVLFDGTNLDAWDYDKNRGGWVITDEGELHRAAQAGFIWSKRRYCDFVLDLEFRVAKGTNSGVFFRTHSRRNWLHTGIEIQVLDSAGKEKPGKHDSGCIYDVQAPTKNTMRPAGEWNRYVIKADENIVTIVLNGEKVNEMDMNRWTEPHQNPDGSRNKFNYAYRDMIREGYLSLQDHGNPVWFRNIRVKILGDRRPMFTGQEPFEQIKDGEAERRRLAELRREQERELKRKQKRKKAARPRARPAVSEKDKAEAAAGRLYRMARQAEKMRQREAAASMYSKIVKDYPGTSFAKRAEERLGKLGR